MQTVTEAQEDQSERRPKATPVARQSIAEVDSGLAECEKVIKACSDAVRTRLAGNGAIPPTILRDLARANAQRSKLVMRRITLLIEIGDGAAAELVEKLLKVKPKAPDTGR